MNVWANLTVVLITLNEEDNIARCLSRLPQGVSIIVLDSGSSDKTEEIVRAFGAQFYFRAFDNYASQKNAALSFAKTPWTLSLDADEELSDELIFELKAIIERNPKATIPRVLRINRRLIFMGQELRYGKSSDEPIRLFTTGSGAFSGSIHESFTPKSGILVEKLRGGYIRHYSYKDLTDYFARFNRYTSRIAENHEKFQKSPNILAHVFRPWFEFVVRYFIRLGFLDGYPGYTYALISSLYTFIKYAKLFELRHVQGSHGKAADSLASHLQPLE